MTNGPAEPHDWQRVETLFARALEQPPPERAAFVERACAAEPGLLERLRTLLAAHESLSGGEAGGDGFLRGLDAERAAALLEDDEPQPGPGAQIGRYRVVRRLGRGGMGVVYRAHDAALDRPVALKLLPFHRTDDPAAKQRFVAEARAASALDHPNVATVYEIGEADDGRLFIAMACYDGETLRQRLRDGPLPVDEAVEIAAQVADGLAAAHDRGIVHRDIKPENLVFAAGGALRILDFGIAKVAAAALTGAGVTLGTVAYMSPEQTRGDEVDHRADLWALGVVLYEMLAGRRPFAGETNDAVIYGIRNDAPRPLGELRPEVPPALARIVERCLVKDPARRFGSAAALRDALRGSVSGPALAAGRRPRRARWRRAALGAGVALAAVVALLVAGGLPRGAAGEAFPERGWVVVADFAADDDAAGVALAAGEALAVDLHQSGFVNVVSRAQLAGVLRNMGLPDTTRLVAPLVLEVAERAGAGAVLTARVSRLGPQYVISGRAIRPGTGDELFAVRTAAGPDGLLDAVERLSREVRRRLGEQRHAIRGSRPLPDVSTASLEALRLYAAADRLASSDLPAAVTLVEEAIGADPGFAMAHRLAGTLAASQLRHGDARGHLARAWALRDRLSERERRHIDALYHMTVALEPRRAADAYELLLRRYPDDPVALFNLGSIRASWLGDFAGGYEATRAAVDRAPWAPAWLGSAIRVAYLADRPESADSLARRAAERGFPDVQARWALALAAASAEHDRAAALCDSLLAAPASGPALAEDREFCGGLDIAAGRLASGIARLTAAQQTFHEAGRYRNIAHTAQAIALGHVLRGDTARAVETLASLLARIPADALPEPDRYFTRVNLQVQAALLRRPALVARIGAAYPPYPEPDHWIARNGEALVGAAGAVTAGEGAHALALLDAGVPADEFAIGWRIWEELIRGLAFLDVGRPDSAALHFRRAADPRYRVFASLTKDRIHLPLALRGLAAAERAREDDEGLAHAYGRLLALWSHADPELHGEIAAMRAHRTQSGGAARDPAAPPLPSAPQPRSQNGGGSMPSARR